MKRALVTGATGFTGRFVVSRLIAAGLEVNGLSTRQCDIRDAAAIQEVFQRVRPAYVVHLAGTPHLPNSEFETAFDVNVNGTVNLLEACWRLPEKPQKIIIASSSYVYGDTGTSPAPEDRPAEPLDAYGKSKWEMEREVAPWLNRLPIVVVRPFNYTGVGHGDRFLVPKLVQLFYERGSDASFVDPDTIRDYSDVRWVARVYAELLRLPESGFIINVCSGIGTPLLDLISILENLTGHIVTKRTKSTKGQTRALIGSPSRLFQLLRTRSPYSLTDTVRWMLESKR